MLGDPRALALPLALVNIMPGRAAGERRLDHLTALARTLRISPRSPLRPGPARRPYSIRRDGGTLAGSGDR